MIRRALLLSFLIASPCPAQSIDTMALRGHTRFLASDLLEGRGTGTRGEHLASLYIASQLTRMGIRPAGADYLLPVPLKRALIDNAQTSVTFNRITYRSEQDFIWHIVGRAGLRDFSGPLLFLGAVDSTLLGRAAETRGRVVVLTHGLGASAGTFVPALINAGAVGIVVLVEDSSSFALSVRSRGPAQFFVDAAVSVPVWQPDIPYLIAGPSLARAIRAHGVTTPFTPITGAFEARFKASFDEAKAANIAGVIPGSHPKLAAEYVVYTAHYDHLGISIPDARGDSIYNGFSDNAAGVAMLLAIGDVFRRNPPARSILLLFFTGEERGLLGSTYYVTQPPLPLDKIAGLINLDAGAPPAPPIQWRIAGGANTPLGLIAKQALEARKWTADLSAASPNSDYWPFLQHSVPSIFIIPGRNWENVTEEQQKQLNARWDRYHQAGDEWNAEFPFSGMARYAEAALAVGRALAK